MPGSHALQEDAHWLGSPCNKKNEKNTEETKKSHSSLIFNFAQVNSCCLEVSSVDPWFTCSGGSMSPSPCSIFATSLACQAVMRYCGGGNYRAGGRDHFEKMVLVPQRHSHFFQNRLSKPPEISRGNLAINCVFSSKYFTERLLWL